MKTIVLFKSFLFGKIFQLIPILERTFGKLLPSLFAFFLVFSIPMLKAQESQFIHVDQFGYQPNATKTAVISNPEVGFNSALEYRVGNLIQLIDADTRQVVYSGQATEWDGGAIHSQSGDRGWWFDFSSYTNPGTYYVYDTENDQSSAIFEIKSSVYDEVLMAATKMFYYNRAYIEKASPYVLPGFEDGRSFEQDEFTRDIYDQGNAAKSKDMRGGWYDAGDNNKYVTFAEAPIHDLLWAYRNNPELFTDNFNIPESENGIPDILDEIKWETDWILKMMNSDGSVHIKMGNRNYDENVEVPPSSNTDTRYYAPTCSSASIATASMLAHTATVFSEFPTLASYTEELREAALQAWNYVLPALELGNLDTDCDDGSVVAGDADRDIEEQKKMALSAAVYLFELTGEQRFNQYIIDHLYDTDVIRNAQWSNYNILNIDALLLYTTLTGTDATTVNTILESARTSAENNYNNYFNFNELDLYRAYSNDWTYHWGSNYSRADMANLNLIFAQYDLTPSNRESQNLRAKEMLHYYHGVNPLSLVYLSNMKEYGAENSLNEIYHFWYADGTAWDNAETSTYGPAPGYLSGGPNSAYDSNTNLRPPYDQPLQKSYLDFNTSYPDSAWEITEPAIYYQAAYVRLLSNVMSQDRVSVAVEDLDETANDYVSLQPNPTRQFVSITCKSTIESLKIYNSTGQLIREKYPAIDTYTADLQDLPNGIYFIQVNDNSILRVLKQ